MKFERYTHDAYASVCDFLVALNQQGTVHLNWNWARFEWMYQHPYCDRSLLGSIGLWKEEDAVVGAAIFDLFRGEAFCAVLPGFERALPEIYCYAYEHLRDENGLGIAVADADAKTQGLLTELGYIKAEQTEPLYGLDLQRELPYTLPAGFTIREIHLPEDWESYLTVIWKGFDHEGDMGELDTMHNNAAPLPPNINPALCLAVDDGKEFAAHCCCWYDSRTDYAYIEPVCTIPKNRSKGLAKAVLSEALNRCRGMGAKRAIVLSDQPFYQKLGFAPLENYTFYWKQTFPAKH